MAAHQILNLQSEGSTPSEATIQCSREYALYDTLILILKNAKCSFDIPQKRVAISNEEIMRVAGEISKGNLPLSQPSIISTKNLWIEKDSDRDRSLCIGPRLRDVNG